MRSFEKEIVPLFLFKEEELLFVRLVYVETNAV